MGLTRDPMAAPSPVHNALEEKICTVAAELQEFYNVLDNEFFHYG